MSPTLILLAILINLLTFLISHVKHKLNYWHRQKTPSPYKKPSIWVGNFEGLRKPHSMAEILTRHYEQFFTPSRSGSIGYYLLKNVLIKDFQNFTDRGLFSNEKDDP